MKTQYYFIQSSIKSYRIRASSIKSLEIELSRQRALWQDDTPIKKISVFISAQRIWKTL